MEDLLRDPATYALAAALPDKPKSGRPRAYPAHMWVVYRALLSTWGSARQVEAELAHPVVWNLMRKTVKRGRSLAVTDAPLE